MAYLFAHFTSEQNDGEQVYFSLSTDGLHWNDLGNGQPTLKSTIGEMGVRDPFLVKQPVSGKYFLIGTDLKIQAGKGWGVAQHEGSRDIVVWESTDLINWGKQRNITLAVEGAGCLWAPESIWDEEKQAFFVFWSSMVKLQGDEHPKQRIYAAHTTDFKEFTMPFIYYQAGNHVIDMNIIHDSGWYYRFMKDETTKKIKMDRVKTLDGIAEDIHVPVLATMDGVEGPQAYKLPCGKWCLIVDRFGTGKGYLPIIINDLATGDFAVAAEGEYDMGKLKKRHGGVIEISEVEAARLRSYV